MKISDFFHQLSSGQTLLMDSKTLKDRLKKMPTLQIIDIRAKEAYEQGHIEGAKHLAWQDTGSILQENNLDKKRPVVVACYTGQSSMQVATLLKLAGYDAYSLLDGMAAWHDQ